MKKNNIFIIAVCVCIVALCALFALNNLKTPNVTDRTDDDHVSEIQKAREISNCVRLAEGKDFIFPDKEASAENDEVFSFTVTELSRSVFDFVFLKTKTLLNSEATDEEIKKTAESLKAFESLSQEKKIVVECDLSISAKALEPILQSDVVSGIALRNTKGVKAEKINSAVQNLYDAASESMKIYLELEENYRYENKLDLEYVDFIFANLNSTDSKKIKNFFSYFSTILAETDAGFIAFFRADYCTEKKAPCSYLLNCVNSADEFESVSMRAFNTFSDVLTDSDNCFTAVKKYIKSGIDLSLATKKLSIDGYNNETVNTSDYKLNIVINGSNIFPLYFEGEKLYLSEGKTTLELSLKSGMNRFELSQGETKLTFKVKVDFKGDIISSIDPTELLYAVPGKKFSVVITAAANADVYVKMGSARHKAKQTGGESEGYCEYTAKITAPESELEINSIGRLKIIATYKGESTTKYGPTVVYCEKEVESTKKESSDDKLTIGNFIESPTTVPAVTEQIISQDYSTVSQFTKGQMCIVDSGYADTWSPSETDADYIPYYTTLANGTIDYVIGQCLIYDGEEDENREFYILASGRKVQKKSVRLIQNQNYGDNTLEILSFQSSNGELSIRIKTSWNVPYSFGFTPQSYYTANFKKYNVESFTADKIQFTFYHTSAATGAVDASGSDVVSSASWSIDSTKKTASLIMPLKTAGKYYGYSIKYESDGSILLTVQNKPKALSGSVIVLDPGHGGKDGGANGLYGAVKESQINFAVSVALKNELEKRGATVYLTRVNDVDVTLEERKSLARQINPDIFISIHANASVDTSKIGTSVYYFRPMSQPLAKSVYTRLFNLFSSAYGADYSSAVKGSLYHPFSVTRLEECPSILIETGFITNERECKLLLDAGNRDNIAKVISDGIADYFNS